MAEPVLTPAQRAFIEAQRRAVLATVSVEGRPRLVPVCFVLGQELDERGRSIVYTPIDQKEKASPDPHQLARVRDILVLPEVTLLFDRWSEDWSELGWLRAYGVGAMLEPEAHEIHEHARVLLELRRKYPQYADQELEDRPIIRVSINRVVSWGSVSR